MESATIERPDPTPDPTPDPEPGATPPPSRRKRHRGKAALAALLLLGVTLVVLSRTVDADAFTPVPQLLAFLPWLLAPTALALVLSLVARWWTGLAWGVIVLAALAWYIEPYGKATEPTGPVLAEVRVMTSNVEFGQGTDALIKAVRRDHPDIVFVEECELTCSATLRDTFGYLDDRNGGTGGTGGAKKKPVEYPYRQSIEGYGPAGSVILSRYPLTSAAPVPGSMGMPGAIADIEGRPVRLQLAHPMPPLPGELDTWRRELDALRAWAAKDSKTPAILAGDFNASQDHAAFRAVLDTGLSDAARLTGQDRRPTWPSRTTPRFGAQIDHVLVSHADFSARGIRFLKLSGTDHEAVTVDLALHRRG
ncbi:endonuclease/exonuclease/phosphatase family protein [Streptomyces scabiei]|uniref:endonuclease/exonuclease/phosphatase family protein n=1 Tax=Streptomyces scabiei TaxID=1930 RepID=UPI00076587DD|nr:MULTISPECIES: endonuclease/exonuclease/phosphatase family protein [Streptomyces]MBP5892355.1 endonuclease/exonuclease/phosphatase family protein [Streptomyces sp. LBUM 1481]MBP5922589.1 endonuclease/exonuclease/phosphatase family protein [Streptomyces sp. LBUM 1483]MDX2689545.1 endonuclease/exonuclease/phosphatase family protein [Streptomyces scabiei]MDX2754459.1 endonuclease/exonuclease/phosphatase family protein [Streptomyces scabiei]MDX2807710.1 endonuclease/exonuclease/phosphatase famil